jgi:hypothetical protein
MLFPTYAFFIFFCAVSVVHWWVVLRTRQLRLG